MKPYTTEQSNSDVGTFSTVACKGNPQKVIWRIPSMVLISTAGTEGKVIVQPAETAIKGSS